MDKSILLSHITKYNFVAYISEA